MTRPQPSRLQQFTGDSLCEMAILTDQPRSATVIAATDVVLLRIRRSHMSSGTSTHEKMIAATIGILNDIKLFWLSLKAVAAPAKLLVWRRGLLSRRRKIDREASLPK